MNPNQLPQPKSGKSGWPWARGDDRLAGIRQSPLVSIVTPSLNQADFLEETIRSVLLQGYPNIEYMIIDGGSSDGSVDLIKRYERWLSYWESAPDNGQAHAVTKGWRRASGSILAYLNSDDLYLPGAVSAAVSAFEQHPEAVAVCGGELLIDSKGYVMLARAPESARREDLLNLNFIPQPSVFISRRALEKVGFPDISLKNAFDFDLWIRLAGVGTIVCIREILSATRIHTLTKTLRNRDKVEAEITSIVESFLKTAGKEALSAAARRQLLHKLSLLSLEIALDNPLRNLRKIITQGVKAAFLKPACTLLIAKRILYRLRQPPGNNPWGLSSSGTHVGDWHPGIRAGVPTGGSRATGS